MCELRAVVILTVAIHCGVMWKGGDSGQVFLQGRVRFFRPCLLEEDKDFVTVIPNISGAGAVCRHCLQTNGLLYFCAHNAVRTRCLLMSFGN